jgi:hypothetical protein
MSIENIALDILPGMSGCSRRVLLGRPDFERRVKEFIARREQQLAVE